jgi:hypothetical protein
MKYKWQWGSNIALFSSPSQFTFLLPPTDLFEDLLLDSKKHLYSHQTLLISGSQK